MIKTYIVRLDDTINGFEKDVEELERKWGAESIEDIEVDEGYLGDWYIDSVNNDDPPVWSDEHIAELVGDFHLIPREREE